MFQSSPLVSKLMALSLLVAVFAALWILVVAPVIGLRTGYREDIQRSRQLIADFEARRPDIEALAIRQQRLADGDGSGRTFWDGGNPTLAAAKLQSRLKSLTTAAGARLVSSQIVTGEQSREKFPRVTVRGNMVATADALVQIFHAMEAGRPSLFLDNVTISTRRVVRTSDDDGSSGLLTVRFDAYGYMWQTGSPS